MGFNDLLAARNILKSSIEKSRDIAVALDKTGSKLEKTSSSGLPYLQAAIHDVASKCSIYEIKSEIDRAIGPAAGALKVLGLVYELQASLETDPRVAGLFAYINDVKRLQEALKLLVNNCRLATTWLEDVVRILGNRGTADGDDFGDWYLGRLSTVMKKLEEPQGKEYGSVVLSSAIDRLEHEYKSLATESRSIDHFPSPDAIQELQAIIQILAANGRLDRCISIYTEARVENARATLRALSMDIQLYETVSSQTVESYIDLWDQHMEFVVRHLLHNEHRLCSEVYREVIGSGHDDAWMNCFAKIASRCGFMEIFDFASRICESKKEAIKLLRLLRIFSTLDRLRLDFNDLFGGRFCIGIQNKTRGLVRRVVRETCGTFRGLSVQVELQRAWGPPPNGSTPRLVRFVTDYCNHLLEEGNSSILARVLEINRAWNNNDQIIKPVNGQQLLSFEINNIIKALEINLETWARSYEDAALSHLFMMNSHWYLFKRARGTELGKLMGDSWVWAHEGSLGYHAVSYMRESWEKIVELLREDDLTLFPGGRAVDRDLVKKRISIFCEAFDNMYRKQSKWILSDKALRWKICQLIVETIVPPYKSYLQRFMPAGGLEYEIDVGVKHSGESLENLIGTLFQLPKLGKHSNSKCTDLIVINTSADHVIDHFPSTPAAAC
ncbi:exocyst subunit exo70 family protein G1 [Striga hermonthica]|uniref:Exocyst subunit Exo70 family protein n=1 Tax=Striga hermonthica TaxID=68872 RepID=A0A9N7MLL5_STRHE|nr:exocyst subunit exo70 family protein G1 [Striga hermonthica]